MKKVSKKLISRIVTLLFLITFTPNVYAATGYSVGSLFASGTGFDGDDFRTNVINAANAYGRISDISSYYNTDANYSYLQSTTRLGNSRVFFINGHSTNTGISSGSRNTVEYKTGVSINSDGWIWNYGTGFKTAGLNSRSMSGTRVITFAGCNTAGYVGYLNNLTDRAVAQGATAALGWYESIITRSLYGPQWLKSYNDGLGSGKSLVDSIYQAKVSYPQSILSDFYAYRGNRDIAITPSGQPTSSIVISTETVNDNINQNENNLIFDNYIVIDSSIIELGSIDTEIRNENLNNYSILFSKIIDKIKLKDSTFNPKDYKVTYHVANEEDGYGDIFIRYFIDGRIETNKVYLATFENYDITKIVLAGVEVSNIDNVRNLDMKNISNKLKAFESNKEELLLSKIGNKINSNSNILKLNGEVNISSIGGNIIELSETYFYDYNTGQLQYILKAVENIENLYDAYSLDIVL